MNFILLINEFYFIYYILLKKLYLVKMRILNMYRYQFNFTLKIQKIKKKILNFFILYFILKLLLK